jgi:isopenicillin N synthase-like dioxygenase
MPSDGFAHQRENELAAEAATWDTGDVTVAGDADIPVVDVGRFFADGDPDELEGLGDQLRHIGENLGFHLLVGHGIDDGLFAAVFDEAAEFLTLPEETKRAIEIDGPHAVAPGIGYLPVGERRLPRRPKGNLNEAILFKQDRGLRLADNSWPDDSAVPGFRQTIERYAAEIERVAVGLLPLYARALELPSDFFVPAFASPFWRLRLTRYPPVPAAEADQFGIAPHVDTTFFTLLSQSGPGLTIFGEQRQQWLQVPVVPGALVVNTGELLKQWSNDRFISVKHFVPPHQGDTDRYSVPFFFNATADHPMVCLPTCHGPDNPPLYPPVSYLGSQAAAQRE